ncbi:MAG: chaperone modulator CbpM [Gaiellaceae bacterium]
MATATPARTQLRLVSQRPTGATEAVGLDALAREAGLHPDLVRRFVRLGLLEQVGGTRAAPLFPREAAARLARAGRLRRDLGLNYAGAVLACELLARIDTLEARLQRYEPRTREVSGWTRIS